MHFENEFLPSFFLMDRTKKKKNLMVPEQGHDAGCRNTSHLYFSSQALVSPAECGVALSCSSFTFPDRPLLLNRILSFDLSSVPTGGTHYQNEEKVVNAVTEYFDGKCAAYFRDGIFKSLLRWEKCINLNGGYAENYSVHFCTLFMGQPSYLSIFRLRSMCAFNRVSEV